MMRIDGPGLEALRESLGLIGVGAQITEFPDGVCEQVVNVADLIRRGRTATGSTGIFTFQLQTIHPGAGTLEESVDPYNAPVVAVGAAAASGQAYPPWPSPVPAGYDVWIFSSWLYLGADVLTDAILRVANPASIMALTSSTTDLGEVASSASEPYAAWATTRDFAGFIRTGLVMGELMVVHRAVRRIRRGALLTFSSTATGAGTITCQGLLGLFPAGLGQDVG